MFSLGLDTQVEKTLDMLPAEEIEDEEIIEEDNEDDDDDDVKNKKENDISKVG